MVDTKRNVIAEGEAAYEAFRAELMATPELRRLYEEEAAADWYARCIDAARQCAVLAPLHVGSGLAMVGPRRVQHCVVPIRPEVSRRPRHRVVAHPDLLLVARLGPRQPRLARS